MRLTLKQPLRRGASWSSASALARSSLKFELSAGCPTSRYPSRKKPKSSASKVAGGSRRTPEERLRVEAVASVVDDAWTAFLPPLGPDAEYVAFRRFHGDLGGNRLLVEGGRRGFAIERDFEGISFGK